MYNIMIFSREEIIEKNVVNHLKTNSEIKVSALTDNRLKAIDLSLNLKPEIILFNPDDITDFQTIKEITNHLPDTLVIIISAIKEFKYAQLALKLGVFDYLQKPVTNHDLDNVFKKAVKKIKEINEKAREIILLKEKLNARKSEQKPIQPPWSLENELFTMIEIGNSSQIGNLIEQIVNFFNTDISLYQLKDYFNEIISITARLIYNNLSEEHFHRLDFYKLRKQISDCLNPPELQSVTTDILIKLTDLISPLKQNKENPIIKKARTYIENNYQNSLTLSQIAKEAAISPNYLSKLFKEHFQTTIITYLTKIRIKKAINLLRTTDLPINEIASRIGYQNANYFSKVFKKHTGKTPTEYRQKIDL